jgi:hypothetical protein
VVPPKPLAKHPLLLEVRQMAVVSHPLLLAMREAGAVVTEIQVGRVIEN